MPKKKIPESINPFLVHCPFCNKEMKGRSLAGHVKRLHANDPAFAIDTDYLKSSLPSDGVEIMGQELSEKLKRYVVDENGFLVPMDSIPGSKYIEHTKEISGSKKSRSKSKNSNSRESKNEDVSQSRAQTNVFESIKLLDQNIPGARIKKIRPQPRQQVLCPICHKSVAYKDLFNHIANSHKDQEAKIVLAKFNLEFERWVKQNPNKYKNNKDSKW